MVSVMQRQLALHRLSKENVSSSSSSRGIVAVPSFIFDPREAVSVDLSTLRELALTSLQALSLRQPLLAVVEPLFSDTPSAASSTSCRTREFTSLSHAEVLDKRVTLCCDLLGPFFLLPDTHYILEYLVRQYEVHRHNQDALLAVALPYHDSPFAARLIRLLHFDRSSPWAFLQKVKTSEDPITTEFFTRSLLQVPFFVHFLLDAVVRATSPLSPERLREAELPVPDGLKRIKAQPGKTTPTSEPLTNQADCSSSLSAFAVQNTAMLTFFTVVISDAINVAGPTTARTLTASLFPLILSSVRPTTAIRSPELHAAGLTLLGCLASAQALESPMLVAAVEELTRSLVASANGRTGVPSEQEHQILGLLFHLSSVSKRHVLRLPRNATRRLLIWPNFQNVFAELVFGQRLDCAPFLTALYYSLFSFFLSRTDSPLSLRRTSFSRLQCRLLSAAEAVCALLSRREVLTVSPALVLEKRSAPGVSPALFAVALTISDFFNAALRITTETSSEHESAGERGMQGSEEHAESVFADSGNDTLSPRLLRLLGERQPVLLEALKRVLVAIHRVSPLTLAAALSFSSKAPTAGGISETFMLFVSETLDSVPSALSLAVGLGQIQEGSASGAFALCNALTAESPPVRLAGVRAIVECVTRGSQQRSVGGMKEQTQDPLRRNEDLSCRHDSVNEVLAMTVLEHVADDDITVAVEALRHVGVLCEALPRLVCLSRLLSFLASSLESALPPPRSFSASESGVACAGKGKCAPGPADFLLLAICESPILLHLLPPLLRAMSVVIRLERLAEDRRWRNQTSGRHTCARGGLERPEVREEQGTESRNGAKYEGKEDKREEVNSHQQLRFILRSVLPLSMAVMWATSSDAPFCTGGPSHGEGQREKLTREDEADESATLRREKRDLMRELGVAGQNLCCEALCVFSGPGRDGPRAKDSPFVHPHASREGLAGSPELRELLQQTLSTFTPGLLAGDWLASPSSQTDPTKTPRDPTKTPRARHCSPWAEGGPFSLEFVGGHWTVASLIEISSRCWLCPAVTSNLADSRLASCLFALVSLCISLQVDLLDARERTGAKVVCGGGQALESEESETGAQTFKDSRSSGSFSVAARETVVRCADLLSWALFSKKNLVYQSGTAAGCPSESWAYSEKTRGDASAGVMPSSAAQTLRDSARGVSSCEILQSPGFVSELDAARDKKADAAKGLILLCLMDVVLFASPVRRLVTRFRGEGLYLAAVLTRLLSELVVRTESAAGTSSFSDTGDNVRRNHASERDEKRKDSEDDRGRDNIAPALPSWAGSAAKDSCAGALKGPRRDGIPRTRGLCEDIALLQPEWTELIVVNGLDLVRALITQKKQIRSTAQEVTKLCFDDTAADVRGRDGAENRLASGAQETVAVVLLLLPQWLVISQARSDTVCKAVGQLLASARKLLSPDVLRNVETRKEKVVPAEENENIREQVGASAWLEGALVSCWSLLGDAGLVGWSEDPRQLLKGGQGQGQAEGESTPKSFHRVMECAPSSCAEFLSLLHQARACVVPQTEAFGSRAFLRPPRQAALVAWAVQAGSPEMSAFVAFSFAYLLPRNEQQFAFEGLFLGCPFERILPPLLPLAFRETTRLKECTERLCSEGLFSTTPDFASFSSPVSPASVPSTPELPLLFSSPESSLACFSSFPVLRLAWRALRMHSWSPICSALPAASRRFLAVDIALPFLEWLSSSPAVCFSLRAFYRQQGFEGGSPVRLKFKPFSSRKPCGPVFREGCFHQERTFDSSAETIALVAETTETLLVLLQHRWFLRCLPESARGRLVRAGLRAACAAPELAMQMRSHWLEGTARVGATGEFPRQLQKRSSTVRMQVATLQALSVKSLSRLVDQIGKQGEPTSGVARVREARMSNAAEINGAGGHRATQSHEKGLAEEGKTQGLRTWDALTADFVVAQLQSRMAALEREEELTRDSEELKTNHLSQRFLQLAQTSLEKVRQLLRYILSQKADSDGDLVRTTSPAGVSNVCTPGEPDESNQAPRAAELASQTVQGLLTVCSMSVRAFAVVRGAVGDSGPTTELKDRGGREEAVPAFRSSLRVMILMGDVCRSLTSCAEAGVPVAFPTVVSRVFRSCEECVNALNSVLSLHSAESEGSGNWTETLRSVIFSLGVLLAAVGRADPSAVSSAVTLEALRSCLPPLFSIVSSTAREGAGMSRRVETSSASDGGRASVTRNPAYCCSSTLCDGSRYCFWESPAFFYCQLKLAFVRTALQPLCETAFDCIGARTQKEKGGEATKESKHEKGGVPLRNVAEALVRAAGREGLAGAAATLLLNWERRFGAGRQSATVEHEDGDVTDGEEGEPECKSSDAGNEVTETDGVREEGEHLFLGRHERKERAKQATQGWGSRRALLARLRELLELYSAEDESAKGDAQYVRRLRGSGEVSSLALLFHSAARQCLSAGLTPAELTRAPRGRQVEETDREESDADAASENEANGESSHGVGTREGFVKEAIPHLLSSRQAALRGGIFGTFFKEQGRLGLTSPVVGLGPLEAAEVYCRAASTALLLVYRQLKQEGLPDLQEVRSLEDSELNDGEYRAVLEMTQALLGMKVLVDPRMSTLLRKSGSPGKNRQLAKVTVQERVLTERAEFLLDSVTRALCPLVGCIRVALGCLGVSHTFFASRKRSAELRKLCICSRGGRTIEGGCVTFVDVGEREQPAEGGEHPLSTKLYMAVVLPSCETNECRVPASGAQKTERGKDEPGPHGPAVPPRVLVFPPFEDAETAVAEVVGHIQFSSFVMSTQPADSVYAELLFETLAGRIKTVLATCSKSKLGEKQRRKEREEREDQKGAWGEERLWKALLRTSPWTPDNLAPPVTLLLSLLSCHFLRRLPTSSLGASLSAWDFVTCITCLCSARLLPAFRETCVGAVLSALRAASRELCREWPTNECSSHREVQGAVQQSARTFPEKVFLSCGRTEVATMMFSKKQPCILQAAEAALCLQALAVSVRRGVSVVAGPDSLDDVMRLFLADFNRLVKRLLTLLGDITGRGCAARRIPEKRQISVYGADFRRAAEVVRRLQQPQTRLLGTRVLGALAALCQRAGPSLFLEFASEFVEYVVADPFVVCLFDCPRGSSRVTVNRRCSVHRSQLCGDEAGNSQRLSFVSDGIPPLLADASSSAYSADPKEKLPLVRLAAGQLLKEAVVGTHMREDGQGFARALNQAAAAANRRVAERRLRCLFPRERISAEAALFSEALVAEVAAAMSVSTATKLLLPMIECIFKKTYHTQECGGVRLAAPRELETVGGAKEYGEFLSRCLDDFRLSRVLRLLGMVVSGQHRQHEAKVERVLLTKLFSHLVELFLSRAVAAGAAAQKRVEEGELGQDVMLTYTEALPLMVYGGRVHEVHQQLLWGTRGAATRAWKCLSFPASNILGDGAGESTADSDGQEEIRDNECNSSEPDLVSPFGTGLHRTRGSDGVSSGTASSPHEQSPSVSGPSRPLDVLGPLFGTTLAVSSRLGASFVPAALYLVEGALLCALRCWSLKLSIDELRGYLLDLARSFRGPRQALLQPLPDGSRYTVEDEDTPSTEDEKEDETRPLGKRKRRRESLDGKMSETVFPLGSSGLSVRELCATRFFVLFCSGAVSDSQEVRLVEAVLEDLIEDFTSVLEACRDQAWTLTGRSGSLELRSEGRPRKKTKRRGGAPASRTGVLESSATWFWFELGMPTLLVLRASLRKWNKGSSGLMPTRAFERLVTCSLHALDVLAVLPRISLATFSSGAEEIPDSCCEPSTMQRQGERMRGRADALRLSRLWFTGLRDFVVALFEGSFGDKERMEKLNLALLEKLRVCGSGNIRFGGARLYLHLWRKLGVAMVDTMGDSLQTLVELLEDPDEEIEVATREWIQCIEKLTGESLDEKLKA